MNDNPTSCTPGKKNRVDQSLSVGGSSPGATVLTPGSSGDGYKFEALFNP